MKKILWIIPLLMVSLVMAMPVPAPVVFYFTYEGQPIQFYQVKLTTGTETITRITNEFGGIMVDIGAEGSPDFNNVGSTLKLECGFSQCTKEYQVSMLRLKPYVETFAMAELPPLTCPGCPPCNCNGGGGGNCDVGVIYKCTEAECKEKYPCSQTECSECPTCSETECPVCPSCPSCENPEVIVKDCPDCPTGLSAVIIAIITFLAGGGAIYIWFNKANKVRVKKLADGTYETWHQHPAISGYHNINTIHKVEPHKKGELIPKYEKDADGTWKYVG